MRRNKNNYPVFRLWWETKSGVGRYHTTRKKSFRYRLAGLGKLKTLKNCWFMIEYNSKGDKNESIKYSNVQEALKVARIFTAKDEVIQWIK